MTLIIPPGFGNAAMVFTSASGTPPFVTTIGVDLSEYAGDFAAAANRVMTAYGTAFAAVTDNDLVLDHVTLTVGSDGPGGSVDSNIAPIAMTSSSVFGPHANAVLLRKVTNELGRRGRGRMFLPGTASENIVETDGSLTSAGRASFVSAANAFIDALEGGPLALPPYLFHSAAPADPTPIVGLVPTDLIGIVRGRIR